MRKNHIFRLMTKKKKKGGSNANFSDLKQLIKEVFSEQELKRTSHKQLIKKLGVHDKKTKNIIKAILQESSQARSGKEKSGPKGTATSEITGRVDYVNPRFAFIVSEEL